jgi:hypothetical protein
MRRGWKKDFGILGIFIGVTLTANALTMTGNAVMSDGIFFNFNSFMGLLILIGGASLIFMSGKMEPHNNEELAKAFYKIAEKKYGGEYADRGSEAIRKRKGNLITHFLKHGSFEGTKFGPKKTAVLENIMLGLKDPAGSFVDFSDDSYESFVPDIMENDDWEAAEYERGSQRD